MVFTEPMNFVKIIKDMIDKSIAEKNFGLSVWIVTDIKSRDKTDGYISEYKCNIKHLAFKYSLDDVPFAGIGFGHMKGIIKYPNVGDLVLVAFMDKQPYVLGTIFDYFAEPVDSVPLVKLDELMIVQKEKGSLILMQDNNDIILRASDESGDFNNGARIRINHDGSFKLFNKDNYGVECDKDGNLTFRGVSINATKDNGLWEY